MVTVPGRDPDITRLFQHTDLDGETLESGNVSNKSWKVEVWHENSGVIWRTLSGKVGGTKQIHGPWAGRMRDVEKKIASKLKPRKNGRYVEVILDGNTARSAVVHSDPKVVELIERIFAAANEHISTYLAGSVGDLSRDQVEAGRYILSEIQLDVLSDRDPARNIGMFLNTVPTQVANRSRPENVIAQFVSDLREQEDRLDQLSAAIQSHEADASGRTGALELTGAHIVRLDQSSSACGAVADYVHSTIVHPSRKHYRVEDVYSIENPAERSRFLEFCTESSLKDMSSTSLFHSSKAQWIRNIIRTGLIPPQTQSYKSMFGTGIYFANKASKSFGYMGGPISVLFIANVMIGRPWIADKSDHTLSQPPSGYHSVYGKKGHTTTYGAGKLLHDEVIVYHKEQCTLTHLVTIRR